MPITNIEFAEESFRIHFYISQIKIGYLNQMIWIGITQIKLSLDYFSIIEKIELDGGKYD